MSRLRDYTLEPDPQYGVRNLKGLWKGVEWPGKGFQAKALKGSPGISANFVEFFVIQLGCEFHHTNVL